MMTLTNYLIDVLFKLSVLVSGIALLTGMAALFSALGESITSEPNKVKLVFCVFVVFFCVVIFIIMPDEEIIREFVAG